jgi:putative ABC transport system substrate-binding protein
LFDAGLISYGPDPIDAHQKAAGYVDRILKGEKSADLPVQAPTKFDTMLCPWFVGGPMRRREFITLIGGAAAWPLAARGQQPGRLPTIGYMGQGTQAAEAKRVAAFTGRLRELSWMEGRTVIIDYRWTEGRSDLAADIAGEFARRKVDIIVTSGTPLIAAAKQVTTSIPIVFTAAGDPVGSGLVASLARPGGNVTGLSVLATDLASKRLDLLRQLVPELRRVAIMGNVANPVIVQELGEYQAASRALGLQVITSEIRRVPDIAPAIDALKGNADALYVCQDLLTFSNWNRINTLTLGARLPTMQASRESIEAAGLIAYGPSFPDLSRRAAEYVDKILRGAKPAELPVEQPTKFEIVINLITAKALGITVPPALLARVDEVIE